MPSCLLTGPFGLLIPLLPPPQPQLLSSSSRKIPGSVCSESNTFCLLSTVTCLLLLYRLSFGLFATVCHTIYGLRSRLLLTPASNLV